MPRPSRAAAALAALMLPFVLIACEQTKSANPLSPQIAGPIAGVDIEPPVPLAPGSGTQIQDKDQPLTLIVANPQSNSPRPVQLSMQVATDTAFSNVVFSREKLTPGSNGQTAVPIDRLPTGRVYYWHFRADDGADQSVWTVPVYFQLMTPIVIGTPDPKSPAGNVRVANTTPELIATNGKSSGPFAPLRYQFQVSETQTFAVAFVNGDTPENTNGETHFVAPFLTAFDKQYFWRVRAFDPANTGPWSRVETFLSPVAPPVIAVPPPASSGGGGGGGPIGNNWQACSAYANDPSTLSTCVHDAIQPGSSGARAFEVTKRIAWLLRGQGLGLLIKNGGENTIIWQGLSFSVSRVCYPDGHIYKVISDAGDGGTNGANWADNDFVDKSLYHVAIDPSLP